MSGFLKLVCRNVVPFSTWLVPCGSSCAHAKRLHLLAPAHCCCTEGYDQSLYPGNTKQYSLAAADLFCSIMPSKVGAQAWTVGWRRLSGGEGRWVAEADKW